MVYTIKLARKIYQTKVPSLLEGEIINVISSKTKLFKSLDMSMYEREEMSSSPLACTAKQFWHHNFLFSLVSDEHWVCSGYDVFYALKVFEVPKSSLVFILH